MAFISTVFAILFHIFSGLKALVIMKSTNLSFMPGRPVKKKMAQVTNLYGSLNACTPPVAFLLLAIILNTGIFNSLNAMSLNAIQMLEDL